MAGHSKWANIQHRKNAQDAKRGQLFTKLIREITVAARSGGGDPASNSRLRLAVSKALEANMTKDTIDRAIKRGVGGLEGEQVEEIRYEGYGPGGVAVMVECLTDNRNRTAGEVRHAFSKNGGNLGTDGSVGFLFNKKGQLIFAPGSDENRIIEIALEAGAEDVQHNDDDSIEVICIADHFEKVKEALIQNNVKPAQAEIAMIPLTYITLDHAMAEKMVKLQDMLEGLDDVQHVFSNASISEEIMAKIS